MPLTIRDEADFELLQLLDKTPKLRTDQLADQLDVENREVASRMSWMGRMGLVERTLALGWILTPRGTAVIQDRSQELLTIRELSRKARRSESFAWVTRREFNRNIR